MQEERERLEELARLARLDRQLASVIAGFKCNQRMVKHHDPIWPAPVMVIGDFLIVDLKPHNL